MKRIVFILTMMVIPLAGFATPPGNIPAPEGWIYWDGDEFDGQAIDPAAWGVYGAPAVGRETYNQQTKAMLQTYRPEQVSIVDLPTGERACRIHSVKGQGAPAPLDPTVKNKTGWWSGALSSRDAQGGGKFYPLFSRMEVRARVPYDHGLWNAIWNRHFLGAGVAELDILEYFREAYPEPFPAKVSQTMHLFDTQAGRTGINIPHGQKRYTEIGDDRPGEHFHTYAVQVDPDPLDANHAVISFWVDDKLNYSIQTRTRLGDRYTSFIPRTREAGRMDSAWDMAITGQVGARPGIDVGYPDESLTQYDIYIDWVRVYVRDPQHTPSRSVVKISSEGEKFIDSLIAQLTPEEKVGQLSQYVGRELLTGPESEKLSDELLRNGLAGSILNVSGAKTLREVQQKNMTHSRMKIPMIFGFDVIHGYKTIFPVPLAESCSWDLALMERTAKIAAEEASSVGLHWTFAPMVDIARDARWGRIVEGAGEDTWLACRVAEARVKGFQWNLWNTDAVIATGKHFAGYGAPLAGRDYGPVDMSDRTFWDVYMPPFKAVADAGAPTFMAAFNDINGVPASAHKHLYQDVLHGDWGFDGFVVSDWESIRQLVAQGVAEDDKDAARMAFNAGVDMDMTDGLYNKYLNELVREGKVDQARVDDAVRRILRVKYALGLFDDPYRFCDEQREAQTLLRSDFLEVARDAARKSMVLLKNNGVLPLSKGVRKVAVVGPLADNKTEPLGSWRARGEDQHTVTVVEGLRAKLGAGAKVEYSKGCDFEGADSSGFAQAVALARASDVVIAVVGEKALMSGESRSRARLDLPGVQQELIAALLRTGKPVVVVLMNGRPLALEWLDGHAPAILEAWFPGTQGGNAVADVLTGDYNPSGKLPVSIPRDVGQLPMYYNRKRTGRPGDMPRVSTERHIDVPNSPLYPFGYGLSYTNFVYSEPTCDRTAFRRGEKLTVSVDVTNTGSRDGEEIVQLYVSDRVASVVRPVMELKGFAKVLVKAGETRRVTIQADPMEWGFHDADMRYVVEPGLFDLMVGPSSDKLSGVTVELLN